MSHQSHQHQHCPDSCARCAARKASSTYIRRGSSIDWPHIMVDGVNGLAPEYVWAMQSLLNPRESPSHHHAPISVDQQLNMRVLKASARILSNPTSLPRNMRIHQSIMRRLLINMSKYPDNWQTMRQPKWWKLFSSVKDGKRWLSRIDPHEAVFLGDMLDRYNIIRVCEENKPDQTQEEEEDCCVCFDATDTDSLVTFSCSHACCAQCMFKLLSHAYSPKKRCPICRADIICVNTVESNLNIHA